MSARKMGEEGDAHGGVWAPWMLGTGKEGDGLMKRRTHG
jgi:hypothetical protein